MPFLKTPSCAKGRSRSGLDDPRKGFGAQAAEDYLVFGDVPTGRTATRSLEDYLNNPKQGFEAPESRVRAYRHSDNIGSEDAVGWAAEMDYTRRAFGKDEGRKWYHFVISPDPRDRVSPDEVAEIAREWAESVYPGAQWTAIVHDDNKNHIPHAHITVNSVMPETGAKIHRTNAKIRQEWNTAQKIGREHGLSALPTAEEYGRQQDRTQQATKRTAAERAMENEGRWSWKADIKGAIEDCVKESLSWSAFVDNMAGKGFTVTEGRRGVCFRHPRSSGRDMRVLGATLGTKWTKDALLDEMGFDFSSAASGSSSAFDKPSERFAAKPIPAHLLNKVGIRKPRKAIYPELGKTMDVWRKQGAAKRNIYKMLAAMATIKREGVSSYDALEQLADAVERETVDLAARVETYNRGYDRAMALYDLVKQTDEMAAELAGMNPRFFDRETRKRRNELEERVDANRKRIASEFSRAQGWLADNGFDKLPQIDQAARLAYSFDGFFDEAQEKLAGLRKRANELEGAREAAMRTLPRIAEREQLERGRAVPGGATLSDEQVAHIVEMAARRHVDANQTASDEAFAAEQDVRRRVAEHQAKVRQGKAQEAFTERRARSVNVRVAETRGIMQ